MGGEKDRAEGKWDETKGRVKEAAGDLTDDRETEAKGKADQTKGKAKQAKGDLKDAGEKVKDSINKAFD
ncbi:MAG: CsbD family protein [Actinomycetota bacterium]